MLNFREFLCALLRLKRWEWVKIIEEKRDWAPSATVFRFSSRRFCISLILLHDVYNIYDNSTYDTYLPSTPRVRERGLTCRVFRELLLFRCGGFLLPEESLRWNGWQFPIMHRGSFTSARVAYSQRKMFLSNNNNNKNDNDIVVPFLVFPHRNHFWNLFLRQEFTFNSGRCLV